MQRSTNCTEYTDTISLLVDASATNKEGECRVNLPPTFSCQKKAFEAPDEETLTMLQAKATKMLASRGCSPEGVVLDYTTNLVGSQHLEYSAEKLSALGMASNCYREGNDPNHATHRLTAVCSNQFDMTDTAGRRVRDTNKKFHSQLSTCDVSDEAMPQLMEDARKVAAYHAAQNGLTMDKDTDLACVFSILPQM